MKGESVSAATNTAKILREWGEFQQNGTLLAGANHIERLEAKNAALLAAAEKAMSMLDSDQFPRSRAMAVLLDAIEQFKAQQPE